MFSYSRLFGDFSGPLLLDSGYLGTYFLSISRRLNGETTTDAADPANRDGFEVLYHLPCNW
jgi:hypothetical protein